MKMKRLFAFTVLVIVFSLGDAYSKYGRTCQDIGCLSNEVCVLKDKPCGLYSRDDDCGTYPVCEKSGHGVKTCDKYICPPSQSCRMDKGMPKCFENLAISGNKRPIDAYQPISPNAENMPNAPVFPSNPNTNYPHSNYPQQPQQPQQPYNPNYPQYPGMYPQLPSSGRQTTPRPNIYQPGQQYPSSGGSGGGYVGGQVGSGYPGYPQQGNNVVRQGGGYPVQGGGYPVQGGGYPGQPYSGQNHPGQGGYNPNSRYPQQGGVGYPNQGSYYPSQGSSGNTRYKQTQSGSGSSSILDKVTDTLKNLGLFWFMIKCISTKLFH